MDFQTATDETLAKMAQQGSLEAFDEIVRRYQKSVWALLYKFCLQNSDLDDLTQNAFIKAFQNLGQWKDSGSFKSWLMRVAANCGYDYCRKRKNAPLNPANQNRRSADDPDPLDELIETNQPTNEQSSVDLVRLILSDLKPEDRTLVILQYYEGYTLPEIAETMSWSLPKAKVKSHRTRKQLKEILFRYGIEKF